MTLRTQTYLLPSGGQLVVGPGELLHVVALSLNDAAATLEEASSAIGLRLGHSEWSVQRDGKAMAQCWTIDPQPGE